MLQYKCDNAGVWFKQVNERYSTPGCSACHARTGPKGLEGLSVRAWTCTACNAVHDRDTNSALVIEQRGLEWLVEEFSAAQEEAHPEPACVVNKEGAQALTAAGHGRPVEGIPVLFAKATAARLRAGRMSTKAKALAAPAAGSGLSVAQAQYAFDRARADYSAAIQLADRAKSKLDADTPMYANPTNSAEYQAAQSRLVAAKVIAEAAVQKLARDTADLASVTSKQPAAEAAALAEVRGLDAAISAQRAQLVQLDTALSRASGDLRANQDVLNGAKQQVTYLQGRVAELNAKIADLNATKAKLGAAAVTKQNEITQYRAALRAASV